MTITTHQIDELAPHWMQAIQNMLGTRKVMHIERDDETGAVWAQCNREGFDDHGRVPLGIVESWPPKDNPASETPTKAPAKRRR